jgi:hypothetical protein
MSGCTSEDIELNGGTALEISTSRIFGRYLWCLSCCKRIKPQFFKRLY